MRVCGDAAKPRLHSHNALKTLSRPCQVHEREVEGAASVVAPPPDVAPPPQLTLLMKSQQLSVTKSQPAPRPQSSGSAASYTAVYQPLRGQTGGGGGMR
jgi:hypothetical protein